MVLFAGELPRSPHGTSPGAAAVPREGVAALVGAGPLALAVASLPFSGGQADFGGAGEAVLEVEEGVGVLDCSVEVAAARGAVRARLAASRRRREAGEPGRRCARRERWLAPVGGRPSLGPGPRAGAATGRGTVAAGEGLAHLEEGSGQTGLLG